MPVSTPIEGELGMEALEGVHPLAAEVVTAAQVAGVTLGCAESCTGGLVAAALTSVAGSSAVVRGGVVSYAVAVKEDVLGVPSEVIEEFGVVSMQTAEAMARGACSVLGCDFAVSTTGVAGPGGGTPGTPVGCVCFAVAGPQGVATCRRVFPGARAEVRARAVDEALALLGEAIRR